MKQNKKCSKCSIEKELTNFRKGSNLCRGCYKAKIDSIKDKAKAQRDSHKDGLYTVYYLKEDHYVGITSNLSYRLFVHKSKCNRHVEDVEIVGKYKTKAEAERVEAALHAMGYLGRNPNHKPLTLKQLL